LFNKRKEKKRRGGVSAEGTQIHPVLDHDPPRTRGGKKKKRGGGVSLDLPKKKSRKGASSRYLERKGEEKEREERRYHGHGRSCFFLAIGLGRNVGKKRQISKERRKKPTV